MVNATMDNARKYGSLNTATKLGGVTPKRIKGWADAGLIGVEALPGLPVRYSLDDITALKRRYTTVGKVMADPLAMAC